MSGIDRVKERMDWIVTVRDPRLNGKCVSVSLEELYQAFAERFRRENHIDQTVDDAIWRRVGRIVETPVRVKE